jgi:hypothetical protein
MDAMLKISHAFLDLNLGGQQLRIENVGGHHSEPGKLAHLDLALNREY